MEHITEGERGSTIASLAGDPMWHDLNPVVALELILKWNRPYCRPPLPDEAVGATVRNIVRARARQAFSGGASDSGIQAAFLLSWVLLEAGLPRMWPSPMSFAIRARFAR